MYYLPLLALAVFCRVPEPLASEALHNLPFLVDSLRHRRKRAAVEEVQPFPQKAVEVGPAHQLDPDHVAGFLDEPHLETLFHQRALDLLSRDAPGNVVEERAVLIEVLVRAAEARHLDGASEHFLEGEIRHLECDWNY